MRLRIGETTKIRFEVANAKTYPVDLYYLMDLSNSMSDDRDTIVSFNDLRLITDLLMFKSRGNPIQQIEFLLFRNR